MKEYVSVNESGLSRIWSHTQDHQTGAITAYRGDKDKSENKRNNRQLKGFLRNKGYGITSVDGNYIEDFGGDNPREVGEATFFVVDLKDTGNLEKDLAALGRKFDQDSVLIVPKGGTGAYLLGTSKRESSFPEYNQKFKVGSGKFGKVAGQFLSRIKGREFAFEEVMTYNERWADALLAREIAEEVPIDEA